MSGITKRLACCHVSEGPASFTRRMGTTAARGVGLLRDFAPRLRRMESNSTVSLASLRATQPAVRRTAALGPQAHEATDETAGQVLRIGLTFLRTTAFSPGSARGRGSHIEMRPPGPSGLDLLLRAVSASCPEDCCPPALPYRWDCCGWSDLADYWGWPQAPVHWFLDLKDCLDC